MKAGAAPVEFSVALTSRSDKAIAAVAPAFELTGSGARSTLLRLDSTTGSWVSASAANTGSAPIGADPNATSYGIPAKGTLTIRYRLSLGAESRPQQAQAFFYVLDAEGRQLASATQPISVTAG
ncbi:hypothetical protein ACGF12_31660 [Kitasatospora sp. NPDC048296]|uniref:hypothetical protein n=1 Tax=Kitasatospora sp. NPDC048296 TaxID=3364048 RepID=UPI003719D06C